MNRLAKNSIAAGLTTLLVTTGLSFSANAATQTTSYAEAQFFAALDDGLGMVVNPLGDAAEEDGSNACEPTREGCPAQEFTMSPLEPLEDLTVPAGDELAGSQIGAGGNFAQAGGGASRAASGGITEDGVIQVGGGDGTAENAASLSLGEGVLGDAGISEALADASLEIGSVSSSAQLDAPGGDVQRDYNINDANLVLSVPAIREFSEAVDGVGDVDLSDIELSPQAFCDAFEGTFNVVLDNIGGGDDGSGGTLPDLPGLGDTPLGDIPGLGDILDLDQLSPGDDVNICDNEVTQALDEADLFNVTLSGLNALNEGFANVTQNGVVFDFAAGEIRVDLAAAAESFFGTDINNLPPNTDLLAAVLPSLALNFSDLVDRFNEGVIGQLQENFDLQVTFLGQDVTPVELNDAVRDQLLPAFEDGFDQFSDVFAEGSPQLADALTMLIDGLEDVLQLIVNVPDEYAAVRSDDSPGEPAGTETALRIRVLDGELADILLANSLVGPNAAVDVGDDGPGNNADAVADADGDADGTTPVASIADADSAADADVQASLPNAGAPNLLPFFLLGIALLAFGLAVLLNERRRLGLPSSDNLA